jgi:hypothetical protein
MPTRGTRNSLAFPLLAGFAVACGTPQMVVPPELARDSEVIAVTERSSSTTPALFDESFRFGGYAVDDVDRDWDARSAVEVLSFASDRTGGGYGYRIEGEGVALSGGCVTEQAGSAVALGDGAIVGGRGDLERLGCTCTGKGRGPSKLVISGPSSKNVAGELHTCGAAYRIGAIYENDGVLSIGVPSGYRVDGESPRGAVEVLRPGRVWFARDLDDCERAELACLYAGLLLYSPPQE